MELPQLKRLRWAVRGVVLLGVAASVAANVLHANPNLISQTISAWPPLAFLLTVELCSRIPVHRRSLSALRIAATAVIAGIAGWISYWHMVDVTARYGESGSSPYLIPITVDGLIVVASVSLVELAVAIRSKTEGLKAAADLAAAVGPVVETPVVVEVPAVEAVAKGHARKPRRGAGAVQSAVQR